MRCSGCARPQKTTWALVSGCFTQLMSSIRWRSERSRIDARAVLLLSVLLASPSSCQHTLASSASHLSSAGVGLGCAPSRWSHIARSMSCGAIDGNVPSTPPPLSSAVFMCPSTRCLGSVSSHHRARRDCSAIKYLLARSSAASASRRSLLAAHATSATFSSSDFCAGKLPAAFSDSPAALTFSCGVDAARASCSPGCCTAGCSLCTCA
mmetsp:Transcript_1257/g.4001  ORF Transcript_1257/g.4001 Transcript_1257/m.4001 type:complete len:209 (+) Transcript_1257:4743-5369(+)